MTKISKYPLDEKDLSKLVNNFWNCVVLLENKKEIAYFFKDLLTHTETKMFAKRIQIAKMLIEGYSYSEIQRYAKVTNVTISKISNMLAVSGEGLKHAIRNLQKFEQELDDRRMKPASLKEKYPTYFLPEIIGEEIQKKIKRINKRRSARISI